jgi:hypothetical protein
MQTTLRAALAITILALAAAIAADRARAMPLAAPVLGPADLIVRVTSVCGVGGCAMVFTKRVQHPPLGFVKRAVPLAIPRTTAVQPVNATK